MKSSASNSSRLSGWKSQPWPGASAVEWLSARLVSRRGALPLAVEAGRRVVGVVVVSEGLGLAEFLADLRAELARARDYAADDSLRLAVDQVEVSLEVTSTLERSGETDARVTAKFWVRNRLRGDVHQCGDQIPHVRSHPARDSFISVDGESTTPADARQELMR